MGSHRSQQKSPVELNGSKIRCEDVYLLTQESQLLLEWMRVAGLHNSSKKNKKIQLVLSLYCLASLIVYIYFVSL